jgi:hypothetical protein
MHYDARPDRLMDTGLLHFGLGDSIRRVAAKTIFLSQGSSGSKVERSLEAAEMCDLVARPEFSERPRRSHGSAA